MNSRKIKARCKEMKDLKLILEEVPEDRKPIAQSLYNELEFMQRTLVKLRAQVDLEGPTSVLVQGPQEMPVQNPALKGYAVLIQRYGVIYKQLTDLLPKSEGAEKSDALVDFLNRYK